MRPIFDCSQVASGKVVLFLDNGQTVTGDSLNKALVSAQETRQIVAKVVRKGLSAPAANVTDKFCKVCGRPVIGKRADRQLCSARCRKTISRRQLELAGVNVEK